MNELKRPAAGLALLLLGISCAAGDNGTGDSTRTAAQTQPLVPLEAVDQPPPPCHPNPNEALAMRTATGADCGLPTAASRVSDKCRM